MNKNLILGVLLCSVLVAVFADLPFDLCGMPLDEENYNYAIPALPEDMELIQVHTYIRHGDRTTYGKKMCWSGDSAVWRCDLTHDSFPGIDYTAEAIEVPRVFRKRYLDGEQDRKGNCMTGQLTKRGHDQEVINGQHVRAAYVDSGFLSEKLNPEEIFLRADDEPRTLLSAQSFFEGMYPPRFRDDGLAEVINLHTMDRDRDDMTPNKKLCPKLAEYDIERQSDLNWMNFQEYEVQPILELFSNLTNTPMSVLKIDELYDCLKVHYCHNFPIPIDHDLFMKIKDIAAKGYQLQINYPSNQEYSRYGTGPLLHYTKNRMVDIISNLEYNTVLQYTNNAKFFLYSGHDTGPILPVANAFGIWEQAGYKWSPYASLISIELYQYKDDESKSNSYFVRVVYNGKAYKVSWCDSELCAYEQFEAGLNNILPTTDECPDLREF